MKYADVIAKAGEIIEEYAADELTLTLRQMYYQFVARGLIPNGQKHYKSLGQHLTNARYRGDLDPGCLEDRGRSITPADIRTDQVNSLTFKRVALNMDQIRALNPPPFPAKETSSRFDRYVREQGVTDAWELDALDPRALRALIESSVVVKLFDPEVAAENRTVVSEARRRMSERMTPGWFAEVIARDQA